MALLTNLTGQSVGAVLNNTTQLGITISNGEYSDFTVRQGVISGMSNGTALTGSGGVITPSTYNETLETEEGGAEPGTPSTAGPEAKSVNLVRFDGQALKVAHLNGDTVLYIACVTDGDDIVGKYVS